METILRAIRSDLRMSMNGVVSASMRTKGIGYRMNFGVDVPRLQQIAAGYVPDKDLAETMWKDDVRELKILATMLYPKDSFTKEDARRWVEGTANQEIREQACRNLFQELPFAGELVPEWIANDNESIRTTGHWLFARLCIVKSDAVNRVGMEGLLDNAVDALKSESLLLRQSALNTLKFFGRISPEKAQEVLRRVAAFEHSALAQEREVFDLLSFEFNG